MTIFTIFFGSGILSFNTNLFKMSTTFKGLFAYSLNSIGMIITELRE